MSYDTSINRNRRSAQEWCGSHQCAAPGCPELISHKLLMCPEHWRQVPKPIQRVVWATWNAMNDGTGTYEAYQSARATAIRSVEDKP